MKKELPYFIMALMVIVLALIIITAFTVHGVGYLIVESAVLVILATILVSLVKD